MGYNAYQFSITWTSICLAKLLVLSVSPVLSQNSIRGASDWLIHDILSALDRIIKIELAEPWNTSALVPAEFDEVGPTRVGK